MRPILLIIYRNNTEYISRSDLTKVVSFELNSQHLQTGLLIGDATSFPHILVCVLAGSLKRAPLTPNKSVAHVRYEFEHVIRLWSLPAPFAREQACPCAVRVASMFGIMLSDEVTHGAS